MRLKKQKTVYCMMSGGVDSSVAAALLKKRGFKVIGIYMKGWSPNEDEFKDVCTWAQDQEDARRIAGKLKIPFYTFNFEKQYYQAVVKYLLDGYRAGLTPNPDVLCNQAIKFGVFFEKAVQLGADYIASGHYARVKKRGASFNLLAGVDKDKDQSYFLYRLTQRQLACTLFPIGIYKKSKVRELAKKLKLPNADKKDSQGICFIGKLDLASFLRKHLPIKKGEVVTTSGKIIGQHDGVWFYTIGQRQGLGIGGGTPYYVARKDMLNNRLIVAQGPQDKALFRSEVLVADISWINAPPPMPARVQARIRYQQPLQKVRIEQHPQRVRVVFDDPQRAVTPGQMCVFYKGQTVLGGGVII